MAVKFENGAYFNPQERDDAARIYREAILRFVEEKRLEEVLGQGEIASLEERVRIRTLMKGVLPNIVSMYRRLPRLDCKPGILFLVHYCADNPDGLCRLSIKRFGQILSRKQDNIRAAMDDLEAADEIGVHRSVNGNCYWPKIARVVLDTNPALGWFLDAFSDAPRSVGRPRKNTPPRLGGDFLDENTPPSAGVDFSEKGFLQKKTSPTSGKYPPNLGGHRSLKEASNKRESRVVTGVERTKTPQPQACEVRL
jgi:hypothetical protein